MDYFTNYIINKKQLINNINLIKNKLSTKCKLCAVVKADCYGLGYENIVPIIDEFVDFYAVASVGESKRLREFTTQKILILGALELEEIEFCADNNISVSANNLEELQMVDKYLKSNILNVHLKINTGMNRFGVKGELFVKKALNFIKKSNVLNLEGVYTHFATSGEDVSFLLDQYDIFNKTIKKIDNDQLLVHCSSSFAVANLKQKFGNMARVGFVLYDGLSADKNILEIKSKIIHINNVKKGDFIGYGLSYKAERNLKVGVVGFGYADGFSRSLSNNFSVLVNDRFVPVIGSVCMDCFMVDLTNIKNVYVGSEVVILGTSGENKLQLSDYAKSLNTSEYEVLVSFNRKRCNIVMKNNV